LDKKKSFFALFYCFIYIYLNYKIIVFKIIQNSITTKTLTLNNKLDMNRHVINNNNNKYVN